MSFLRDRSPVTPKITSALGPGDAVEAAIFGVAQRVVPARDLDGHRGGSPAGSYLGGFEEREHFGLGIGEREGDDGAAVTSASTRGIAGGLRLDELAEGERTTGDLQVDVGAARGSAGTRRLAGPPLWNCPVECRNRGPQPNVVGPAGVGGDELAQTLELRQRAAGRRRPGSTRSRRREAAPTARRARPRRCRMRRAPGSETRTSTPSAANAGAAGSGRASSSPRAAILADSTSG